MKFAVEFETQSDPGAAADETVHRALVSAFGRIDKFRIVQIGSAYIGYIQENRPITWREVRPERPSSE